MSEKHPLHRPASDIDPAARALLRHKVTRLIGSYGFTRSDADDLEQELALQAHLARSHYDPTRGPAAAFYDAVISNKVRSIVAHATAQRRSRRREQATDQKSPLASAEVDLDLRLDVADALAGLSSEDRAVAARLATDTVAGVARATGTTRGRGRTARGRIGRRLAAFGLDQTIVHRRTTTS